MGVKKICSMLLVFSILPALHAEEMVDVKSMAVDKIKKAATPAEIKDAVNVAKEALDSILKEINDAADLASGIMQKKTDPAPAPPTPPTPAPQPAPVPTPSAPAVAPAAQPVTAPIPTQPAPVAVPPTPPAPVPAAAPVSAVVLTKAEVAPAPVAPAST